MAIPGGCSGCATIKAPSVPSAIAVGLHRAAPRWQDRDGIGLADVGPIPAVRTAHLSGLVGPGAAGRLLARRELDLEAVAHLEPVQRRFLLLPRPPGGIARLVDLGLGRKPDDVDVLAFLARLVFP